MYNPRGTSSFIASKHSTCWLLEISQNDMVQHTCFFVCQHIAKIDLLKKTPTNLSFKHKYTYTNIYIIKYIHIILVFHLVLSHEAAFFLAPASWLAPCFPAAQGNEIPSSHSKPPGGCLFIDRLTSRIHSVDSGSPHLICIIRSWRLHYVALHFAHFLLSNTLGRVRLPVPSFIKRPTTCIGFGLRTRFFFGAHFMYSCWGFPQMAS